MKIFISHSSKNKDFGNLLVDLLRSLGIKENEIIFTSNTGYGIPISQNIFHWLKAQITDSPFVIYLLSEEYYKSVACLNEMGAAWIIENEHAAIFTPNFNLSSKEFQGGALDPREIGFYINDEERILSFIQLISKKFEISTNAVLINQHIRRFLEQIKNIDTSKITSSNVQVYDSKTKNREIETQKNKVSNSESNNLLIVNPKITNESLYSKFIELILNKKMKDDEILLLYYVIETGRSKLMTGWQEDNEIKNIVEWEKINDIKDLLSKNYSSVIKRFELRGFTEVSAITSSNNPKELKLKDEIFSQILDLSPEINNIISEVVKNNFYEHVEEDKSNVFWDL
ncbi:toll/interleukin-1 receptor domain-containing protein [Chryseobacterium polytrichastri]|uniref:TIR domain-containing protein n=1 Tax=Chryseobacterium polytrichastri TaxID=1302687 RepID=A0A1M7FSK7_9FLAO|nr:toll/interleukin-1 receptor domain-containing protein [Chryseobacterium polytrichastri]SHM06966.1 TIR domain-containing protein [Chryseobacterium polytrichastri]